MKYFIGLIAIFLGMYLNMVVLEGDVLVYLLGFIFGGIYVAITISR